MDSGDYGENKPKFVQKVAKVTIIKYIKEQAGAELSQDQIKLG